MTWGSLALLCAVLGISFAQAYSITVEPVLKALCRLLAIILPFISIALAIAYLVTGKIHW
jgi:hypothetical protein